MRMVVTLKSGTQIKIPVTEFTTGVSRIGSELRTLRWQQGDGANWASLSWVDLHEIAAVHSERDEADLT